MRETMKGKITRETDGESVGNGWYWEAVLTLGWQGYLPDGNYRFWNKRNSYKQFRIVDGVAVPISEK
jgi:hypothetical protein